MARPMGNGVNAAGQGEPALGRATTPAFDWQRPWATERDETGAMRLASLNLGKAPEQRAVLAQNRSALQRPNLLSKGTALSPQSHRLEPVASKLPLARDGTPPIPCEVLDREQSGDLVEAAEAYVQV